LSGTGGALAAALHTSVISGQPAASAKTKLILLGTAGGPRPRNSRAAPSQVIWVNNTAYVVDCGNGVAIQMTRARLPLTAVRHVFITHQHSDHNADYGNLLLLAWQSGLQTRVDTWGPPPLDRMTSLFFEMNAYDIDIRIKDEGRTPLIPLIHPHQVTEGGALFKDDHVAVTCALVEHPPIAPAFAYRFDTGDRSIVISGDTRPCDALIRLARNADILVHEVMYPPALDRLLAPLPNAATLKKSILSHHTPAADVGRVAQEAGVKTLVLSHFVPAEDPSITEEMWIETARGPFTGRIIAGRDLLEI
jgi:ribonuclease BN (tRNA processing enzyme)